MHVLGVPVSSIILKEAHKSSNIKYITNKWKYVLTSALNLYSLALTVYSGTACECLNTSIEVCNPCLMNEGLQLLQQLVSLDKRKGVIRNCKFVRSRLTYVMLTCLKYLIWASITALIDSRNSYFFFASMFATSLT